MSSITSSSGDAVSVSFSVAIPKRTFRRPLIALARGIAGQLVQSVLDELNKPFADLTGQIQRFCVGSVSIVAPEAFIRSPTPPRRVFLPRRGEGWSHLGTHVEHVTLWSAM
jgi:hypothetical protein